MYMRDFLVGVGVNGERYGSLVDRLSWLLKS